MFNEADNIAETILKATAVAKEIAGDYEIIVVDDASTDKSVDIVNGLALKDSHIRLIRGVNLAPRRAAANPTRLRSERFVQPLIARLAPVAPVSAKSSTRKHELRSPASGEIVQPPVLNA